MQTRRNEEMMCTVLGVTLSQKVMRIALVQHTKLSQAKIIPAVRDHTLPLAKEHIPRAETFLYRSTDRVSISKFISPYSNHARCRGD